MTEECVMILIGAWKAIKKFVMTHDIALNGHLNLNEIKSIRKFISCPFSHSVYLSYAFTPAWQIYYLRWRWRWRTNDRDQLMSFEKQIENCRDIKFILIALTPSQHPAIKRSWVRLATLSRFLISCRFKTNNWEIFLCFQLGKRSDNKAELNGWRWWEDKTLSLRSRWNFFGLMMFLCKFDFPWVFPFPPDPVIIVSILESHLSIGPIWDNSFLGIA